MISPSGIAMTTWKDWNLEEVPPFLLNESHQFLMIVNGFSPVHLNQSDRRDWGETRYSMRIGYKTLISDNALPEKSAI